MAVNSLFYSLCGGATFKNDSSSGAKKKKTAQGRWCLNSFVPAPRLSESPMSTHPLTSPRPSHGSAGA